MNHSLSYHICPLSVLLSTNFSSPPVSALLSFTMTCLPVLIPPCQCSTTTILLTAHSSILYFTSPAKSLSNRCRTHSVGLPSVWVCVSQRVSVALAYWCMPVCERQYVWACEHACVSVEQAWPRLIAASYLVVTGLIKDDGLTVGLSLSFHLWCLLALSLPLLLAGKQTASGPPLWVVFGEERRTGGWWQREGEQEGERKDKVFRFSCPLLRGQHGSKNWPECLRGWGTQVAAQWAYSTPLKQWRGQNDWMNE